MTHTGANKTDIQLFLAQEFPQSRAVVLEVGQGAATIQHLVGQADLRPGGTVSGPTMMALADVALYVAILGAIGIVPLTVTTSLTINFLRKPVAHANLLAVCKLIKVGQSLAVGDVSIYSEGSSDLVAHAVGTYAIPRKR